MFGQDASSIVSSITGVLTTGIKSGAQAYVTHEQTQAQTDIAQTQAQAGTTIAKIQAGEQQQQGAIQAQITTVQQQTIRIVAYVFGGVLVAIALLVVLARTKK